MIGFTVYTAIIMCAFLWDNCMIIADFLFIAVIHLTFPPFFAIGENCIWHALGFHELRLQIDSGETLADTQVKYRRTKAYLE